MRLRTRHRAAIACVAAGLLFTGYSARLVQLQVAKHEEYTRLAAQKHSTRQPIYARRGLITDRHGEILAANKPVRKVVLDASHVNDRARLAALAAPVLGMSPEALDREFASGAKYKVLARDLPEEAALDLRRAMTEQSLRGLYFHEETTRIYPNGRMLCHLLGFLSRKNPADEHTVGVEGVERAYEERLRGSDGFRHTERDRTGREIVVYRGAEEQPRHGDRIELTVDMGLQAIVEEELDAAWVEHRPASAVAILIEPRTGEILALANRPAFDLNDLSGAEPAAMINRAIMDVVEPGSTFKLVVASAALAEGVVRPDTQIFCEQGRFFYGGRVLRDVRGHGDLSVHDILVKSSNIGSAKLALLLGADRFYGYVRLFGFGERTGVGLPGEAPGLLDPPKRWDRLTITRMPMGHSIAVTPLQLAMATAAVANGGVLMRPQFIRAIYDAEGRELVRTSPHVVRQVIPADVARLVGNALAGVTGVGGTAKLASVPGFEVAGKTGTAEKVDPKGGYLDGRYVVSFTGYMPAENPAFVALVLIDDAKVAPGVNYGGLVAAPVFARIAEKAARNLGLVPSLRAEAVLPLAFREGLPEGEDSTE